MIPKENQMNLKALLKKAIAICGDTNISISASQEIWKWRHNKAIDPPVYRLFGSLPGSDTPSWSANGTNETEILEVFQAEYMKAMKAETIRLRIEQEMASA
jgi:hypothetical protein